MMAIILCTSCYCYEGYKQWKYFFIHKNLNHDDLLNLRIIFVVKYVDGLLRVHVYMLMLTMKLSLSFKPTDCFV